MKIWQFISFCWEKKTHTFSLYFFIVYVFLHAPSMIKCTRTRYTRIHTRINRHTQIQPHIQTTPLTYKHYTLFFFFFLHNLSRKQNGFFLQSEHKIWKSSVSVTYLKYFPSGKNVQQRRCFGVGIHSCLCLPFTLLDYQFNTYNALIPAVVAVAESNSNKQHQQQKKTTKNKPEW